MATGRWAPGQASDLAVARRFERMVYDALLAHQRTSRVANLSEQTGTPDFEFEYDGGRVGLEVKTKLRHYAPDVSALWPELSERRLFIVDEVSLRKLLSPRGLGYLLVYVAPESRWVVFGPWHLLFGPHRRYELLRDEKAGPKGKLLVDLRVAEHLGPELNLEHLLQVVTRARKDTKELRSIRVREQRPLPVLPRFGGLPALVTEPPPSTATGAELDGPPSQKQSPVAEPGTPSPSEPPGSADQDLTTSEIWRGLDQRLVDDLVITFGWSAPTPVQAEAIPPILDGFTTLVLAPTAGGKTEAALLPLLDVARRERWSALSIVAVSPMKALLDDQLRRYEEIGALIGATAFAWHGDTPTPARRAFLDSPNDILLTTPESLEILLHNNDAKSLFGRVRAVVIDEVHAFVGTPRGAQLAAVLERLAERSVADVQRVGLSATVGEPEQVLAWLGGSSHRQHALAQITSSPVREETNIATYDDDSELVALLDGVVAQQRTLLFVQSRRRAEDLARSTGLPVHHSSVHAAGRQSAIAEFRRGGVAGIIATSTLELGIDIGDVELVAQDGSPAGPASYLQRVGRSGRRSGLRRMLFTCGSPDDLLQVLAVLARVRRGALESLPARRGARLVLGQQALALALDPTSVGMSRSALTSTLCHSPVFRGLDDDVEATLDHLLAHEWLAEYQGLVMAGSETQQRYGGRGLAFSQLAVSFETQASIGVVVEDGTFVGFIDWSESQADKRIGRGEPFTLGGHTWRAVDVVDGAVRVARAHGVTGARSPSWRGSSLDVARETWETAQEILAGTEVPAALDDRGAVWLGALRAQWQQRLTRPIVTVDGGTTVATFAGAAVHRSVMAMLGLDGTSDGPVLHLAAPLEVARSRALALLGAFDDAEDTECRRLVPEIAASVKHGGLVPESVLVSEAREFVFDRVGARKILTMLAEN